MTSPSLDQYLRLSPEEQARQDDLYWKQLNDPQYRAFLAGLFSMSIYPPKDCPRQWKGPNGCEHDLDFREASTRGIR
jgi:hypothetical protein